MNTSLCSRKRVGRLRLVQRFMALTGILLVTLSGPGFCQSKEFYETDNYNPLQESKYGRLGTLFNAQPHLLLGVPTTLHGPQDVWTTAYLPFVDHEFDPSIPLTLFGPNYTTGIALSSPRDPALELYAPIQVRSIRLSANNPGKLDESALAKSFPPGQSPLTAEGPFNEMLHLNKQESSFASEQVSFNALTALGYAQQFGRFSHEVLTDQNGVGWNGSDKNGKVPIRFSVIEGNMPGVDVAQHTKRTDGTADIEIPNPAVVNGLRLATIGHEIGHAINFNVQGSEQFSQITGSLFEINEGFCTILGHSFRLWTRPEKFTVLNWEYFGEYVLPGEKDHLLNDPKLSGNPSTYLGENYQTDVLAPSYEEHRNGRVLEKWFSLIVDGGKGYVDDKVEKGAYWVKPLVPGDVSASYVLALRVLFRAFTNPMVPNTDYPLLRTYVLQASQDLGYPPGSHVYEQVSRAWAAVGVGQSNTIITCDQTYAETLLNGTVQFPATKAIGQDPAEYAQTLSDCSQANTMLVLTSKGEPFTDWDGDKVFSETNDEYESKVAVSIYHFGRLSRDFFKKNFDHGGYDVVFKLIDGNGSANLIEAKNKLTFTIPLNNKQGVADRISRNYFGAVNQVAKKPLFPNMPIAQENEVWYIGLANIFALEIRREFELLAGNPEVESLWTTEQDYSDLQTINDFSDPKKYGQPALYKGQFWVDGKAGNNAGIINFFYYLLAHGTKNDLGQDDGYTNVELPGKVYFVNAIDRRLVWKVLWNAYLSVSYQAGIEEFRQATFVALQQLDPVKYHSKSKEYIAFYDAWAAVLGLPDYASNLKHFPSDGNPVYPWAVTVGMEVEYPLYESYRLFEVSKSSTFKESDAPVHRFVSKQSPDVATGMTYSDINLEGGQVYWVRTRLAEGEDSRQFCATTDDPHFCESLLNKKKWSIPFAITTESIPAPQAISPGKGEQVRAWGNTFSFGQTYGARGYDLYITDPTVTAATHTVSFDDIYDDEDPGAVITHDVALSARTDYSYKVAARQKLGSEWAVHVLPGGLIKTMTTEEKDQFLDIYSDPMEEVFFKTDLPTVKLGSPADGAKVPLFGSPIDLKAKEVGNKRADYYILAIREPLLMEKLATPEKTLLGTDLLELVDGKDYKWTITPMKKATAPFIPEDEAGKVPDWYHFQVSKDLVPAPVITQATACVGAGKKIVVSWEPVPGAKGYEYAVIDLESGQDIARDIVTGMTESPAIAGASTFPKQYKKFVRAGVQDSNGNWVWGKAAEFIYNIRPETVTNLLPSGQNPVPLDENNAIHFSWQDAQATGLYRFNLMKLIPNSNTNSTIVDTDVSGTDILVEGLEFDTDYQVGVNTKSSNGCNSATLAHPVHTAPEPVTVEPELDFDFDLFCFDAAGWGLPGPTVLYNLDVNAPDGTTLFHEMALKSHISHISKKLPAIEGVYSVDGILTQVDIDYYAQTDDKEGSIVMDVEMRDTADEGKLLDSDFQAAEFEPVKNMLFHFKFEVNTTNFSVNHKGNAGLGRRVRIKSAEFEYPQLDMTIFPNPAGSQVQIMPGLAIKEKQCTLEVIDQQGRTVISRSWQGEKLDVSTLAEGMYVVRVKSGALTSSQKLFVKK